MKELRVTGFLGVDEKVAKNKLGDLLVAGVEAKTQEWENTADRGEMPDFRQPVCQIPLSQITPLTMEEAMAALKEICAEVKVLRGPSIGLEVDGVPDYKNPEGPELDVYRRGYAPVADKPT